jgi:hypothetical protein
VSNQKATPRVQRTSNLQALPSRAVRPREATLFVVMMTRGYTIGAVTGLAMTLVSIPFCITYVGHGFARHRHQNPTRLHHAPLIQTRTRSAPDSFELRFIVAQRGYDLLAIHEYSFARCFCPVKNYLKSTI